MRADNDDARIGASRCRPPRGRCLCIQFRFSYIVQPEPPGNLILGFDSVLPYGLDGLVAQRVQVLEGL
jgi:hypothetical protein